MVKGRKKAGMGTPNSDERKLLEGFRRLTEDNKAIILSKLRATFIAQENNRTEGGTLCLHTSR